MTRVARIAAALFVFGCIAGAARTASAATLDPFRTAGGSNPGPARRSRSVPAGAGVAEPGGGEAARAGRRPRRQSRRRPRPRRPSSSRRRRAAKACQKDEDCGEGNICKDNVCQAIELSTNLFPLYYREGSFTEAAIVYWARKGNPGYTVVFPFYWHLLDRPPPTVNGDRPQRLLEQRAATRARSGSGRCSTCRTSSAGRSRSCSRSTSAIRRSATSTARCWGSTGGSAHRRARSTSASCRPTSRHATRRTRSPGPRR